MVKWSLVSDIFRQFLIINAIYRVLNWKVKDIFYHNLCDLFQSFKAVSRGHETFFKVSRGHETFFKTWVQSFKTVSRSHETFFNVSRQVQEDMGPFSKLGYKVMRPFSKLLGKYSHIHLNQGFSKINPGHPNFSIKILHDPEQKEEKKNYQS